MAEEVWSISKIHDLGIRLEFTSFSDTMKGIHLSDIPYLIWVLVSIYKSNYKEFLSRRSYGPLYLMFL